MRHEAVYRTAPATPGLLIIQHVAQCPWLSATSPLGDSMSKVREKRSTSKSGFFFNEMWKTTSQIDDVGRFWTTFVIFGCF